MLPVRCGSTWLAQTTVLEQRNTVRERAKKKEVEDLLRFRLLLTRYGIPVPTVRSRLYLKGGHAHVTQPNETVV